MEWDVKSQTQHVLAFTGPDAQGREPVDPHGVAVDNAGAVYVVDQANNRMLKMSSGSNTPTALPFNDLNAPSAVAVDAAGAVYVSDYGHNRVVRLVAGSSSQTELNHPHGVAVDGSGALYIADWGNNRVLKVPSHQRIGFEVWDNVRAGQTYGRS
ncbi:MAG TPA: hypothetical protein VME67_26055 [Mycobacterium sp.]|nr:hypothetical protein [Mycobacterium sp.]HTX97985.1 hypothetical protein [Mycobacterium sp.]